VKQGWARQVIDNWLDRKRPRNIYDWGARACIGLIIVEFVSWSPLWVFLATGFLLYLLELCSCIQAWHDRNNRVITRNDIWPE